MINVISRYAKQHHLIQDKSDQNQNTWLFETSFSRWMLGNEWHRNQAIRFSCTYRRDSFRDKRSRTKHWWKNHVCTTNKIWYFRDRLPWNKRNWFNNCLSNIQDLCLATLALWSGDTTIDKNPDQSPRRLSSKFYKVHAVASSKNAVSAVYLLIGAYPVETEIHQRQLSLLYSLLFCHNGKIKEVVSRQISVNYDNTKSFFCNIRKMMEIYELPKIHELQSNLPPKPKWKNLVNSTIKKYWTEKLKEETSGKTTLKFMSCDHLAIWL